MLKNIDEIDFIILIHGFDFKPDFSGRAIVVENIENIAKKFGKNVIEVDTNIRDFGNSYVHWDLYHGSVLGSVSLLLSGQLKKMFIPSSHSFRALIPWASHYLTDPLWGSENMEIVHDGCEATRVKKVDLISKNSVALQYLRVCWENNKSAFNCGKCEKCLRTMVTLYILNSLDKCKTFQRRLDLARIARVDARGNSTRDYIYENLEAIKKYGGCRDLEQALKESLCGLYQKGFIGWPRRLWNLIKRGGLRSVIRNQTLASAKQ